MNPEYPPPLARLVITAAVLTAAFMTQLDSTIAVVALPHMQASTSASAEQIVWVLTSYMVMAAIFTPLSGWLATRYGQMRLMLASVIGFTIASMLCGMSANFGQLIGFRLLQGVMGAALLPISQAILLDINPPERHGSAMALWGMGAVVGPIVGPVLGGYVTDYLTWRWIFFINLPVGLIAATGMALFMRDDRKQASVNLDMLGFGLLAIAVGSFQLLLDRGQMLDWFDSREIWIETALAGTAFSMFLVHTFTHERPFIKPVLFTDSNYVVGTMLAFFLGGLVFSVMALTPPLLAELMGYPLKLVGLVSAPRGITMMIVMLITGRLIGRVDWRLLIIVGLAICAASMRIMAGFSLEMDSWRVIFAGIIQGIGAGIMFVPVATIIFATLPSEHRNEGAAASSLIRSLSGSIWISVLHTLTIRNAETVKARLVETVTPDSPIMALRLPDFDFTATDRIAGMNGEIVRQAMMVSYVDTFWALCLACLAVIPLVILVRR